MGYGKRGEVRICPQCQETYTVKSTGMKYCSAACMDRAEGRTPSRISPREIDRRIFAIAKREQPGVSDEDLWARINGADRDHNWQ